MNRPLPPRGTDLARAMDPQAEHHAAAIEAMLQQLLIALVKRAGGTLIVPVSEVDDTAQDMLSFRVTENREFEFVVSKKS